MPKLPLLSGKELVKLLARLGYQLDHQTGSHMILRQTTGPYRRVTVPNHKEVARGTLSSILREAGLSREEFMKLYYGD